MSTINNTPFKILAIDGGGIRGACPAAFLHHIEECIDAPIHRFFDLIVGTSTGGIIALAVSRGVPVAEILELYRHKGKEIFKRRHPRLPKKLARVTGSLYRSDILHKEIRHVLGKNTVLGDAACRICIPAVNITSGDNVVFKTRHHKNLERDHRLPMWRVAAATAAAPTYFSPVEIPDFGWFVDGGVWANSPAMVGVAEGIFLGHRLEDIRVLSLGTGTTSFCMNGSPGYGPLGHARFSLAGWGTQLVDLVMRAQTQRVHNFTHYFLPSGHNLRVTFELPPGNCSLDDVDMTEIFVNRAFVEAKKIGRKVRNQFFKTVVPKFTPVP